MKTVLCRGGELPDTLIVQNKYQFKPALPFSPGSEVAGRIVRVGAKVASLRPGDRVIGQAMWGGFAEELAVHESACTPCLTRRTSIPPARS